MFSKRQVLALAIALPLAIAIPILRREALTSDTQNELINGDCKPLTVIFARGTTEDGNVGQVTGPPMFQALADRIGEDKMALQGVDYPARNIGYLLGGSAPGSKNFADLTKEALDKCPDSQVVMSGYSQGAQLVHNAAKLLPADITAKVAAVVLFGDPFNGTAVAGVDPDVTKVFCHEKDLICKGLPIQLDAHESYGKLNADDAAEFIIKVTGIE